MSSAEQWWAVGAGLIGLLCFAAGALITRAPVIDLPIGHATTDLRDRREQVIAGSLLTISGATLLLWPLALVASEAGPDGWTSLAISSMAAWVFGFGFLSLAALLTVAVVWRLDAPPDTSVARTLLDLGHLATWSISAPVGAIATVATTAVGVQTDRFGPLVVAAAVLKVATAGVEIAGTGRQQGWNAGGWARGTSGYATVLWFALVIIALVP